MNSRLSAWKLTLPSPHGHRPATARTSVLLPEPDSPATSTRSPGSITTSVSLTTAVPSSSDTERLFKAEHRIAFGFAAPDASEGVALFRALEPVERHHQRGDAPRTGVPIGETRIVVDQPSERALHDGKGRGSLHHLSKCHATFEKFRSAKQNRHDRRKQARPLRHQRCAHVLACKKRPLPEHIGERLVDAATLLLLAAEQCDTLAVFPHARQRVAEFGFRLILFLGEAGRNGGQ